MGGHTRLCARGVPGDKWLQDLQKLGPSPISPSPGTDDGLGRAGPGRYPNIPRSYKAVAQSPDEMRSREQKVP
jgi:hypothetical protein